MTLEKITTPGRRRGGVGWQRGGAGGVASVFIFHDWWIAAGVMIDGINVRHWPPRGLQFLKFRMLHVLKTEFDWKVKRFFFS